MKKSGTLVADLRGAVGDCAEAIPGSVTRFDGPTSPVGPVLACPPIASGVGSRAGAGRQSPREIIAGAAKLQGADQPVVEKLLLLSELIHELRRVARKEASFEDWLKSQEIVGLLNRGQVQQLERSAQAAMRRRRSATRQPHPRVRAAGGR